ncbi:MAG: kynureninase [Myxococcota bacterium]
MSALRNRIDDLADRLRPHYQRFLGQLEGEVLMTAHSHQAWPDVSRQAHLQAWDDAARWADKKWAHVFETVLPRFQRGVSDRLGSPRSHDVAIGLNTHELTARLLSCFPKDAVVLTTDQEFHSVRRQLLRSKEAGLRVEELPASPLSDFASRFVTRAQALRPHLAVLSHVFFTTGAVVSDVKAVLTAMAELRIPVVVDTYHSFNVLQIEASTWPGDVFVVGGGYKYAQTGEGACWMLVPEQAEQYRPEFTGWFADFEHLEAPEDTVRYGPRAQRFMGSTFDPTPFYRGGAVFDFMDQQGLTPAVLQQAALDRTQLLIDLYDDMELARQGLDLATPRAPHRRAGFVAFRRDDAPTLCDTLRQSGFRTDVRGSLLRFGPAPYSTSEEIERALLSLSKIL